MHSCYRDLMCWLYKYICKKQENHFEKWHVKEIKPEFNYMMLLMWYLPSKLYHKTRRTTPTTTNNHNFFMSSLLNLKKTWLFQDKQAKQLNYKYLCACFSLTWSWNSIKSDVSIYRYLERHCLGLSRKQNVDN